MPVFNVKDSLLSTLKSLSSQNYPHLEIIAIDDHSTDGSLQVLSQFKKLDKRLKIYRNIKRYGLAVCLNRGIKKAKGRFVTFMDPRDFSTPNKLKKQVQYLLNHPRVVAVGTQCLYTNKKSKRSGKSTFPLENSPIYEGLLHKQPMQYETALLDRKRFPKDVLYFKPQPYPVLFTSVFLQVLRYGKLANIHEYLHIHFEGAKHAALSNTRVEQLITGAKLWVKSITVDEYRPNIRQLFSNFRISTS